MAGIVKVNRHESAGSTTFSSHNPGEAIAYLGAIGGWLFKRWKLTRLTLQPHLLRIIEFAFAISVGIVTDQRVMIRRYKISLIIALRKSQHSNVTPDHRRFTDNRYNLLCLKYRK